MISKAIVLANLSCAVMAAQPLVKGPVVVFIGPPSSGKSTQAAVAAKSLNVPVVSAEQIARDNVAYFRKLRQTPIAGMDPRSDPALNKFFAERLNQGDLGDGFILDGYPATKDHADYLGKLIEKRALPNPVIIQLSIPDAEVRKRARQQPGFIPSSMEQRLKDYHREMTFARLYYPNADIVTIDGRGNPKKVTRRIEKELKQRFGKAKK